MSPRAIWWIKALWITAAILLLLSVNWDGPTRAYARQVYVKSWRWVTPDVPPPDRFAPLK